MGAGTEALQQMQIAGVGVKGVLHVGANDGQERYEYKEAGDIPVIYVEPIDSAFANLQRNIADLPGHIAVQALCSDRVGDRIGFNISSNDGQSSSILELGRHANLFPSVTYVGRQEMTTTTVDSLLSQLQLPSQPNLLVMDTQGSELQVLRGARDTLRSVDGIYVEVSEEPLYAHGCTQEEITKFLKTCGFSMRSLAINGIGYGDAFYLKTMRPPTECRLASQGSSSDDSSIIEALSLMTPFDIDRRKARIGPNRDGGYILIPDLFTRQPVLSYGIDGEYQFDIEMALRGHAVYMFDHTIPGIVSPDPNLPLHWIKEGIAGKPDGQMLNTLENQLRKYVPDGNDLILRMDVEGCEYEAFDATSSGVLRRFEQIIFEIHGLHSLPDPEFRSRFVRVLRKLNLDFTLFHVHANNFDGPNTFSFVSGVPVSNLLELSYVRTDLVNRWQSETLYPTELDFPNVHSQDKKLWFFPFLPTSLKAEEFMDSDLRMERTAAAMSEGGEAPRAAKTEQYTNVTGGLSCQSTVHSTAGLINIALGKPAEQSSPSKWSQGVAGDAVSGLFPSDFAFHTEIEDCPWWQVDLGSVFPLEAIIVHNRVTTDFQNRARTITIEVADSKNEWILVHTGFAQFGGSDSGTPFEAWLGSKLRARYIRISLAERQYLHLAQVGVFARAELVETG
jgi:FkbM family methyltransferase